MRRSRLPTLGCYRTCLNTIEGALDDTRGKIWLTLDICE